MRENYIQFGQYRITTNVKKKIYTELKNLVKEKTTMTYNGEGELKFQISKEDTDKILEYEIENLTNIRRFTRDSIDELVQKSEDEDLVNTLDYLNKIMLGFLHECKESVIEKIKEISQIKKNKNIKS